jgi:Predicted membrane protein involved in D-alanine export
MLFNSLHFLVFFPIVAISYFLLPHRIRWVWLLVASYYFYMSWNPRYAILMAISTLITYLSGIFISRTNEQKNKENKKKLWVALSFISNLSILFFFKYFGFAVYSASAVLGIFGIKIVEPAFDVLLPVGISFYTFQALGYTMDVYRGDINAEKNFFKYALFVSFFPQLVAGPIERSNNLLTQVNERHYFDIDRAKDGILLMLWGLFQKIVIADRAAIIVNMVFDSYQNYSGVAIVTSVILFAIQIYCDFSGYTNVARGAAEIMGFRLMDNFRQPYFAMSIQDFWRRWHISLSTWFRDYLYIPLGGNRTSKFRKYCNIFITFLASGLWHGASWNFVVWGGLHGVYQICGETMKPAKSKIYDKLRIKTDVFSFKLSKILVTFSLVVFAWIFFRANGAREAVSIISQIIKGNPNAINTTLWEHAGLTIGELLFLVFNILILFVVDLLHEFGKISIRNFVNEQNLFFRWVVYIGAILLVAVTAIYYSGLTSQQFIYFQF